MTEQQKSETPDALPFFQGGNCPDGPTEKHGQKKAVNGQPSMRSFESADSKDAEE